jgi:hypothetical protein
MLHNLESNHAIISLCFPKNILIKVTSHATFNGAIDASNLHVRTTAMLIDGSKHRVFVHLNQVEKISRGMNFV